MRITTLAVGLLAAASIFVVSSNKASAQTPAPAATQTKVQAVYEEIQPGDSLSIIAAKHTTTYRRLYEANLEITNPDLIYPGNKVRIPATDEQLAERALPNGVVAPVETTAPVATKPAPVQRKVVAPAPAGDLNVWDRLAQCESGGNWSINTGNGYYGGLQFTLATWKGLGGTGYPNEASKSEQIARAQILQARSGWGQWPACTAKLGLR